MYPLVFSTLGCPDWTLEQAADAAVANGYVGLEIRILDGEIIPADLAPARQWAIRELMAARGLKIVGLGASTRFTSPDPDERAALMGVSKEQYLAEFSSDIPAGRAGDPKELGDLMAFLVSPRNTYITGAAIPIDGGKTRRLY